MKRAAAAAVAVLVGLLAAPGVAQRGGARGGSGGHAASGGFAAHSGSGGVMPRSGGFAARSGGYARGGFAPRPLAPRGYAGPGRTGYLPRYGNWVSPAPYRGYTYGPNGSHGGDHWGHGHSHYYTHYFYGYYGYPYAYTYAVWPGYPYVINPWLFTPDDWDYDSGQAAYSGNVPAPYPDYGETEYPSGEAEPYAAQPAAPSAQPARQPYTGGSAAAPQEAVTVIFRDGRPPEKIHNYLLTANTLTVLDGPYRQIPLAQIDMTATYAANRAAGVSFQAPGSKN